MIGGNVEAILSKKGTPTSNSIGERVQAYVEYKRIKGFLDLMSGDSKLNQNAKLVESTHIFICDYVALDCEPDNCQMAIDGKKYNVQYIDNPMGMNRQLEIYLKYLGGGEQ